jgi:hypothetical protein
VSVIPKVDDVDLQPKILINEGNNEVDLKETEEVKLNLG